VVDASVVDLDEDTAAQGEQVPGHQEAISEVRQVRVEAQLPGVLPALPKTPAPETGEPSCTKKSVFLALYRVHPDYGDRRRASRVAAELAPKAGLQPGTARSYLYAELDGRPS
jgi:hypothetical protein